MAYRFKVFHLKAAGDPNLALPKGYWHMATCLRSIVLTEAEGCPSALKSHDFMSGEVAYEFLLSVICGLESPLLGETEVLGQFKEFVKKNASQFTPVVREMIQRLTRDAKTIRTQYLQNLGCTSYGSLLRKELKAQEHSLTLLGAGSLAQDILPWFAKQSESVTVFTRNPEKYTELLQKQNNVSLKSYQESRGNAHGGILVVAAPLSAQFIKDHFDLESFEHIYDLRGDSQRDPLKGSNVTSLSSFFANIEENKKQAASTKKEALSAVRKHARLLSLLERPRPFGWEDLCAYS